MEDLNVDNKKTFIKKGVTEDIVNAVISVYGRSIDNVPSSLLRLVASSDPYTASHNIWEWVIQNIRYKKDPEGEQWIKTPSRLIYDGCGDCKSMTILICAVLSRLGIKNKFRFVSYDRTRNYTHVYPVAIIEKEEIPLDAVAYIQRGTDFGNEIKYTYKKDNMNKTSISELSGLIPMQGATSQLNDNISAAKLVCESYKLIAISTCDGALYDSFNVLSKLVDKYQTDAKLFKIAVYAWITQLTFTRSRSIMKENEIQVMVNRCVQFVGSSNTSDFSISNDILSDPVFAYKWHLVETQILPVLDRYKPDCNNVQVGNDLLNIGLVGLYLFIPDAVLTKTQRAKKKNESDFVNSIIGSSVFTNLAALNYIYAGFVSKYKTTPLIVFNAMFKKNVSSVYVSPALTGKQKISAITGDDDECYTIEYNSSLGSYEGVTKAEVVKDSSTVLDNVGGWIDKATGWFKDIFSVLSGGKNSNGGGVIPYLNDSSGSMIGRVVLGLFVLGGIFLLSRNKKGKRK